MTNTTDLARASGQRLERKQLARIRCIRDNLAIQNERVDSGHGSIGNRMRQVGVTGRGLLRVATKHANRLGAWDAVDLRSLAIVLEFAREARLFEPIENLVAFEANSVSTNHAGHKYIIVDAPLQRPWSA